MQSYNDTNKCKMCSIISNNMKLINECDQKTFSSLIGVELRINSNNTSSICKECDIKFKKLSTIAKELAYMQK